MEADAPTTRAGRLARPPGLRSTAEAHGGAAAATRAYGHRRAGSRRLSHELVDVPADRRSDSSAVPGRLPSRSRPPPAPGVWLQSAAASAAGQGADGKSTRLNSSHA